MELQGTFYFAKQSRNAPAYCTLDDEEIRITAEGETHSFSLNETRINDKLGNLPRKFNFPDGSCFECDDSPEIDAWLKKQNISSVSHFAHKFENSWKAIAGFSVVAILILVLTYTKGIPMFSNWAAFSLPASVQITMGEQTLKLLDKIAFEESELSAKEQEKIQADFQALLDSMPETLEVPPTLFFRAGKELGANALAIPNGNIVITDELIALAKNNTVAIQGVLAHEIAHLKYRHSLRQVIALSAIPIFLTIVAGDLINASQLASSLPIILLEQGYGRDFERESDQYARDLLWSMNIDTQPVADLFEKLSKEIYKEGEEENSMLSTHPGFSERVMFFSEPKPQP